MADCNTCSREQTPPPVPYIVHEAELAREERINKRLCIVIVIQTILTAAVVVCRWFGW